jgi:1-aminocyclopropane-1-carboxylate deaminase
MMNQPTLPSRIDSLVAYSNSGTSIDVLRLDLVHPVISGNKWYKLQVYLAEAKEQQKIVLTFGGAFSNHLVATAAAAKTMGLKCIGIIRGEEAPVMSHSLVQAKQNGMDLFFISREAYKQKTIPDLVYASYSAGDLYMIPEGGYGLKGALGASGILPQTAARKYTHILSAVGTGTTLAGLIRASTAAVKIIGVSVLKNNHSLKQEIEALLPADSNHRFELLHQYHFGGYAKYNAELTRFMNTFYKQTGIPTDFVYTAKAFYAATDLLQTGLFTTNDSVLLVHTGGLQGNFSLPKGTLIFD